VLPDVGLSDREKSKAGGKVVVVEDVVVVGQDALQIPSEQQYSL